MLINVTVSSPTSEETASFVSIDGRTFTFDGIYTIVRHVDGPVAIVSASAVGVTPPASGTAGKDGVMKNPVVSATTDSQGYDDRRADYGAGVNVVGSESSLSPGDFLVASESNLANADRRSGYSDSYQAVYVTAVAPSSNSLSPAVISWTGRSGVTLESAVDWDAKVALIPTYTVTGGNQQTYASIIDRLIFNPGWAQYRAASIQGYQDASPYSWGGPDVSATSQRNYGEYIMRRMGEAIAAMLDNSYSTAERKEILIRLASAGKQLYEALSGEGIGIGPDGGQLQPHPICQAIYLWATGQQSLLATLYTDSGGNWKQVFAADATYVSNLAPFGSVGDLTDVLTYPDNQWTFHRRSISAVSGDDITLPTHSVFGGSGWVGDELSGRWKGLVLTDGTSDFVISEDLTGTRTQGSGSAGITVPGHTFSVSDTVWMKPDYTISAGDPVWGIRGEGRLNSVIPTIYALYQNQQVWMPSWMFLYAVGAMEDSLLPPANYSAIACEVSQPTANQDWSTHLHGGYNAEALYTQHWTTISAISQPNLTP